MNILGAVSKWIWLVALAPYYIIYSKKAGGFGQITTDLETYTLDKLKTKVGNLVMMAIAIVVLIGIRKLKLPMAAKVIIMGVAYFVFGYNLFKAIDDPRGFRQGTQTSTVSTGSYFGRN